MIATSLLHRFVLALGMFLLLTGAQAQESSIDPKMRQRDARLNTPVSLSADHIYLGELLESLSERSGVTLSMDNNDLFSGIMIACDLKQTPLAEAMNALWSLVGTKSGGWEWKADTGQNPIRYTLRPTQNAHTMAARLRGEMQEIFERQAETMVRLAFMSPAEREANIDSLTPFLGISDPIAAQKAAQGRLTNEQTWAGMRLFGGLLSPDQRRQVLRGATIEIAFNALSQEARRAVNAAEEAGGARAAGTLQEPQDPIETISFAGTPYRNTFFKSSLNVMIGQTRGSPTSGHGIKTSASGSIGISSSGLAPDVYKDWLQLGDERTGESETHTIASPVAFQPDAIWSQTPLLDQTIARLAIAQNASFIAVVPEATGLKISTEIPEGAINIFDILGKTPAKYFSEIWGYERVMHKWRDGILLVHNAEWFYGKETQFSWAVVKRLRTALQRQNRLLTLDDIATLVTTQSVRQLSQLTVEFPFTGEHIMVTDTLLGTHTTQAEPYPEPLASICAFYKSYPKSLSEQGMPIDLKLQLYLQNSLLLNRRWRENERPTAVRIHDTTAGQVTEADHHHYMVQIHTNQRDWIDIVALTVVPIPAGTRP